MRERRTAGAARPLFVGAAAAAALMVLFVGCARYYSTDVAGYVKDGTTGNGINGATVRIYLSQPAAADADGYAAATTTTVNVQVPGYFDRKIMWETDTPQFGQEGDSITVWIGVTKTGYQSAIVEVKGILSGGQVDLVPDILLMPA